MIKKTFVPDFIIEKLKEGNLSKASEKYVLFLDIVGFTKITQRFADNGKEGAEIFSEIISKFFNNIVGIIYENGGFVAGFEGDAILCVFDKNSVKYPLNASLSIFDFIKKNKSITTDLGDIILDFRLSLVYGNLKWNIIKSKKRNYYYFYGDAIDKAIYLLKFCPKGKIILDKNISETEKDALKTKKIKKNFYLLENYNKIELPKKIYRSSFKGYYNFADKRIFEIGALGEFRELVSVFISFKGFSKEKFNEVTKIINKYHGYVKDINFFDNRLVLLVYFGAPIAIEKPLFKAVNSALDIMRFLSCKISITKGMAFTGFILNKFRSEYFAMSPQINLASRILDLFDEGIFINEKLKRSLDEFYEIVKQGNYHLKGIQGEKRIYEILEKKEFIKEFDNNFYGRKSESNKIKRVIKESVKNKKRGFVYVQGEAGIGKTVLINNVLRDISDVNVFKLLCNEVDRYSFHPFKEFLEKFFQIQNSQNKERIFKNKFKKLINETIDDNIKRELKEVEPIISGELGIKLKNSLYEELDSRRRYTAFINSIPILFRALAKNKPILIFLDDAHFVDKDSIKIINKLYKELSDLPLILIVNSREDFPKTAFKDISSIFEKIILQKITLNSAIKIIQSILKQRSNVELSNFIYTKSGGNPFYTEQITLYLKQNNMVVLEKGKYKLKDNNLTKMRIPASINEIIISRIDSLTKEVKRVIKTASVLGEKFSIRILSEMLNNENLLQKLSEGKKQKIWYPVNEIIYIFSHALIRDSVYEMQLKKTLRKLHKLAAVSIEKVYKNNLERYYQILGYHFERADMKNRAIKYIIMAAKNEKNKYHNEIAENLYLHALDLIGNKKNYEEQKLKIRLDLGLIKQRYGDLDNAINIFKNAIETSRTQKNIVGDLYNALGWIYYLKRDYDTALNLYNKAIKYFKRNNEELGLSLAYGHIAVVYLMKKQFEKSLEYFDRKKVITNKLKRNIGMVELNVNLGALYIQMENYDKALYHLLEAEKLIVKEKNILYKSAIIGNIGLIYFRQGNFHSALMYFKRDLKLCRLMGDKVKYSITLRNLALLYKKKKNYQKAIMKNMELVELFTKMKNNYGLIDAYSDLGVIYQKKREYVVAEKYSKKAISLDNPNNRRHKIDSNYYNLFLIRKKQKKYKSALNYIKKSIEMAQNIERKKNNLSLYYYEKAMLLKKIKKYDEFINNINLAYKTANDNSEIKLKSNFEILLDKYLKAKTKENRKAISKEIMDMKEKIKDEKTKKKFEQRIKFITDRG